MGNGGPMRLLAVVAGELCARQGASNHSGAYGRRDKEGSFRVTGHLGHFYELHESVREVRWLSRARISPEDSNRATRLVSNGEDDGRPPLVTRLPFHATKHNRGQAFRDLEAEPKLLAGTRRQALGLCRLDGRDCRIDRFGDGYSLGCPNGIGGCVYGRRGRRLVAGPGSCGNRRGATNRINDTGGDDGTDGDEDQPSGLAPHGDIATLRGDVALRNLPPRGPGPSSRATMGS